MKQVCVVGLGYIGLPTASLLATKGYRVLGVDISEKIVNSINEGRVHIVEPDLDILVKSAVGSGNLRASLKPETASVFIVSVPTPFKADRSPDLSYLEAATRTIAPHLEASSLVIFESTIPVGTTEAMAGLLRELRPDLAGRAGWPHAAHCPERVMPGDILSELVRNDRIVGGVDESSTLMARDFYRGFVQGEILTTDSRTAELSKLTENAFRDVNIAFANELSLICDELKVDVWELISLANRHPRVKILQPGAGVGGHCIAVDPWFIVHGAPETARLIRTAREVNDAKPHFWISRIREAAEGKKKPTVALLGLSYKPDIDDFRESPAVEIAAEVAKLGLGRTLVVEPHLSELPESLRALGAELSALDAALAGADVIALLVGHSAFRDLLREHPSRLRELLHGKTVVDATGLWRSRKA